MISGLIRPFVPAPISDCDKAVLAGCTTERPAGRLNIGVLPVIKLPPYLPRLKRSKNMPLTRLGPRNPARVNQGFTALTVSCAPDARGIRDRHCKRLPMERATSMRPLIYPVTKPLAALGLLALLSACGGGVYSIGVTRGCGIDASPYLGGSGTVPVRCGPQTQSPSNWGG